MGARFRSDVMRSLQSTSQSDLARATPCSRSHLTPLSERPPKATPRGRSRLYGETTRSEAWSDLSERPTKVAPDPERPVGATHQSRSRPLARRHQKSALERLPGATPASRSAFHCFHLVFLLISYLFLYMVNLKSNMGLRGIMEISAKIANRLVSNDCFHIIQPKTFDSLLRIVSRLKVDSLIDHLPSLVRYLITQGQEELCFINNNGSWYKKEPNFQYNNYQQKSYPNNKQSGVGVDMRMHLELKDVKQVIIGRAEHGSEVPQRRHESDLARATPCSRSHLTPLSERPPKATPRGRSRLYGETTEAKPGATSQSDLPRSLPIQSDPLERHTKVARDLSPGDTKNRPGATSRSDTCKSLRSNHNASSELATQLLILRHFSPESSILDHPRSNSYAHEFSFPLVKKCFDIPQNWFDNLLYYNICLRSLENS
ncbi:hypothetical protein IGI04_015573 [Brassica rapa subsp. trilocularis]|uniref:Uncharacterized protein n=1 Tax=Brassica rapa subsp. trilocularis TaxID=1813537 RepID=A0ABQ7MQF1_BRACM|nr:hypothetical protein IGI04_015573 [Brassica rapa subsp. trilocularis]